VTSNKLREWGIILLKRKYVLNHDGCEVNNSIINALERKFMYLHLEKQFYFVQIKQRRLLDDQNLANRPKGCFEVFL